MSYDKKQFIRRSFYDACLRMRVGQAHYSIRNYNESVLLLRDVAKGYAEKDVVDEDELFELGLEAFKLFDDHIEYCIDTFYDNIDSYVYAKFQDDGVRTASEILNEAESYLSEQG